MNRTLKTMLAKLCPRLNYTLDRRTAVGSALSPVHPKGLRLFPDQDPIWKTTPSDKEAKGGPRQIGDLEMSNLLNLGKIFRHMSGENLERTPIMLGNWVYPC